MNQDLMFILKSMLLHDPTNKRFICMTISAGGGCAEVITCSNCPLSIRLLIANPDRNIVTQLTKVMERLS